MKQPSFADLMLAKGLGRNERLARIEQLLDWGRIERLLRKVRNAGTGRPPFAALSMFKALLLAQWYGLSDPGLEEALLDRVSFRAFCGFGVEDKTPDETTLCRFRNELKLQGLGDILFVEVGRQLDEAGFLLRAGTMVDATLIQSAVNSPPSGSTPKHIESRSAQDPDANWTRTGRSQRLFFGYKAHVGVDQGTGLIRSRLLTGAKTYESEVADQLIMGDEKAVYADKAYEKRARREALRQHGIKDRIQHRRNKHQKTLPRWQALRNILIGKIRSGVERVFSRFKEGYGLRRMRYRGLEACAFHLDLISIAHNLERAARLMQPA